MTKLHRLDCPVAAMLNIFGDRWTLLIIREAFYGAVRFGEFQRNTGIAKNLLSDRLSLLVTEGVLEKQDIGQTGPRYVYRLTEKGRALEPVLIAMVQWGNTHCYKGGAGPIEVVERASGKPIAIIRARTEDGTALKSSEMNIIPGLTASKATRRRLQQLYNTDTSVFHAASQSNEDIL